MSWAYDHYVFREHSHLLLIPAFYLVFSGYGWYWGVVPFDYSMNWIF